MEKVWFPKLKAYIEAHDRGKVSIFYRRAYACKNRTVPCPGTRIWADAMKPQRGVGPKTAKKLIKILKALEAPEEVYQAEPIKRGEAEAS